MHWPGRRCVRELPDGVGNPAPGRRAVVIAVGRELVGSARVLALGELIHRAHEPLAFRNEVIRYAVTHLGFTAVTIESGDVSAASRW